MDSLATEIINTVNGQAEYNDYDCDDEDVGQAKLCISFGLQRVIDINGQRITLGLEPAIIYKANNIENIWFFDYNGTNEIETLPPYEEFIYPMCAFKGSGQVWNDGKDEVYKIICNGRYGTYNGKCFAVFKCPVCETKFGGLQHADQPNIKEVGHPAVYDGCLQKKEVWQ